MKIKPFILIMIILLLLPNTQPILAIAETDNKPEEQEPFDNERNIYVGDIITLEIEAADLYLSAEELTAKFSEFEVLDITEKGGIYTLSLRTFEPGKHTVLIGNKEIVINVASTLTDISRDDIFEGSTQIIKPGFSIYWRILFYITLGIFILSGSFVLLRFVMKKKIKAMSPYELFLKSSGALSVERDDYFVDLTRYFKEYIGSLYHCRIIGKTSTEIIAELKEIPPLESILADIGEWLVKCDKLKFSGIEVTNAIKQEHYGKLLDLAAKVDAI